MLSADEGSKRAPIVLIGEAFGRWESIYNRPFVGPSYTDKLLPWFRDCNPPLSRDMMFITNCWDHGQPTRIDSISEHDMRASMQRLHERLAALEGPDGNGPMLIVPTGNYALYALTGRGRVSFHQRDGKWLRPGITEWRGSILEYADLKGRRIKTVPTLHPASTFRTPWYERPSRADWQRIATDAQFRELRLPQRTRMIAPSKAEAIEWIRWTRAEAAKLAKQDEYYLPRPKDYDGPLLTRLALSLDVETPKRTEYETRQRESSAANGQCRTCKHTKRRHADRIGKITHLFDGTPVASGCAGVRGKGDCDCANFAPTLSKPKRIKVSEEAYLGCIGYSWDPSVALCIPTTLAYWQDPQAWAEVKAEMAALHADANVDIFGQNFGAFDAFWCATEGMPVHHMRWDLMNMHRVRCPADGAHDLAYQASLYTRERFWKHESKLPDEISRFASNSEMLWNYNATDNCVQRELLPLHLQALKDMGRLEYYEQLDAPMMAPLLELSLHGIRADEAGREAEFARVRTEGAKVADEIEAKAGARLVAKTAVSTAKMKKFLYEDLRLPVQYTKNQRKEKVVSTDVVSILRLMERFPGLEQLHDVGRLVLKHRRLNTVANFVKASAVDADGRIRALFRQDTLLGRLSSSKTPRNTGRNLQNIDRKLRRFFVADTGKELNGAL